MHGVLHKVRGAFGKLFVFHPPLARWKEGNWSVLKRATDAIAARRLHRTQCCVEQDP